MIRVHIGVKGRVRVRHIGVKGRVRVRHIGVKGRVRVRSVSGFESRTAVL